MTTEILSKKADVARAAQVSVKTVEVWVRDGKIPVIRMSKRCLRFDLPAVMEALKNFEK